MSNLIGSIYFWSKQAPFPVPDVNTSILTKFAVSVCARYGMGLHLSRVLVEYGAETVVLMWRVSHADSTKKKINEISDLELDVVCCRAFGSLRGCKALYC